MVPVCNTYWFAMRYLFISGAAKSDVDSIACIGEKTAYMKRININGLCNFKKDSSQMRFTKYRALIVQD